MKYIYNIIFILCGLVFSISSYAQTTELLNVSYDPTREFYESYNKIFQDYWEKKTKQKVTVQQSHGGSGKQARAVIDGLQADIVTLALAYDIDVIADKTNYLPQTWQKRFPHNSSPYNSTIVFLVRKGNPKKIHDWDDLIQKNIQIVTPNPKTSGGARWNYVAAYGYALKKYHNDEEKAQLFLKKLFANVPILDTGARGATTNFAQRGLGDVLITWENEAFLAIKELGKDKFDIIAPSISVLAEPSVAVIDKIAKDKGTLKIAQAYIDYLYSEKAQILIAENFYRPSDKNIYEQYKAKFPYIKLFNIEDLGGWRKIQKLHFDDNGIFDKIMEN